MSAINNLHPKAETLFELLWESSRHPQEVIEQQTNYCYHPKGEKPSKVELRDYFFALYQSEEPDVDPIVTPQGPYLLHMRDDDKKLWRSYRDWTRLNPVEAMLGAIALLEARTNNDYIKQEFLGRNDSQNANYHYTNEMHVLRSRLKELQKDMPTKEQLDELLEDADYGTGGDGAGEGSSPRLLSELEARFALAIAIASRGKSLLKLVEEIGRLEKIRQDVEGAKFEGSDEMDDISVGRDIRSVLPSELAQDPGLFAMKFADSSLLQHEKTTLEREGLGPIYILADKSGSMGGPLSPGLDRDDWTTAATVAIVRAAKKQQRDVIYQPFDGNCNREQRIVFRNGNYTVEDLCKILGPWALGGTRFRPALGEAYESLTEHDFRKGDVLIITDGEAEVSETMSCVEKARQIREDRGARIFCFNVGGDSNFTRKISDDGCYHPNVETRGKADEAMADLFAKLDSRRSHFLLGGEDN